MSPEPLPRVSIVIPTCAGAATLEAAVRCVLESDYPDFEVIVVNNGADAPTQAAIGRLPSAVRVVRSEKNLGFSGGNNLGVRESTGSIVALLNDDTEVRPDWLRKLTEALIETPGAGLAASLILEPDGKTLQHTGSQPLPNLLNAHLDKGKPLEEAPRRIVEREYIMGAAVAIRKDLFAALGGLPECYFPGYYEDFELCHRVRAAGLKIIVEPSARLIHREKQSTRSEQDYLRFYHRHRWLFILRNLGVGPILRALAWEIKWAFDLYRWKDRRHTRPLLHAYRWNLTRLPGTLRARFRLKAANRELKRNRRNSCTENVRNRLSDWR